MKKLADRSLQDYVRLGTQDTLIFFTQKIDKINILS